MDNHSFYYPDMGMRPQTFSLYEDANGAVKAAGAFSAEAPAD